MPDTKISALTAATAAGTDLIPIARGAANYRVSVADIATLAHQCQIFTPIAATTTVSALGATVSGTFTAKSIALSTYAGSIPSVGIDTASGANSTQSFSASTFGYYGNGTKAGGFVSKTAISIGSFTSSSYAYAGVSGNGLLAGTGLITSLIDVIAIGFEAGDANMSIYHNDDTGAPTKVGLGANFPVAANAFYELIIDATANGSATYTVHRRDVAQTTTGTLSTNLPSSLTQLQAVCQAFSGSAGGVCSIKFHGMTVYRKNSL